MNSMEKKLLLEEETGQVNAQGSFIEGYKHYRKKNDQKKNLKQWELTPIMDH